MRNLPRPMSAPVIVSLTLLLLIGCSAASPSASPDSEAAPESNSKIAHLFDRIGPEGVADKQLAIDAFSYMFAPLPGANPLEGDEPELYERKSGTFAYLWIAQHADELTDEQMAAVEAHLAPGPNDTVILSTDPEPKSLAAMGGNFVAQTDDRHERYVAILKEAEAGFAQKIGESLRKPWMLTVREAQGGEALAGTRQLVMPAIGLFGTTLGCAFETYAEVKDLDETSLRTTLAHEMWHCYQGQLGGFKPYPQWLIEGQAEWAGEALMGPSKVGGEHFLGYVASPGKSLYERNYDAAGFFWQLSEHGISPWTHAKAMWQAFTNPGVFEASGANKQEFLQDWAPQLLRDSAIGAELNWHTKGIFSIGGRARRTAVTVAVAASTPVSAGAVTNSVYEVTARAPVVRSTLTQGNGLIGAPGSGTVDARNALLCTNPDGCECPPKYVWVGPLPVPMASKFYLGVTGGLDGANGTLEGFRIEDFCEKEEEDPDVPPLPGNEPPAPGNGSWGSGSADPCDNDCPMSNGDVHIVPISGQSWDFQAVGEFVLFRSQDGSLEIQGRQEPYAGSDDISINTAIAMRVGDTRIGVYGDPANTDLLSIMVDGATVDLTAGPVTVGDALITQVSGLIPGYEVALRDGTRVSLAGQHQYGINLLINPSDSIRDGVVGLMGPVAPDSLGVPALPDGTILPLQSGREAYYEQVYGVFEDAWRVTADTSLFDYTDGRTTESYIDPNFPVIDQILTFDQLTPEQIAAGEAACGAIQIEFLRQQCIYDVAVTGIDFFGELYDLSAEIVDKGTIKPASQRVRVVNLFWDPTTGAQPLDVYAWTDQGAALITTVNHGEVTEWFDPGMRTGTFGGDALVSLQRAGEPVLDEAFNFYDLRMDIEPGLERTYVVGTGDLTPDFGTLIEPTVTNRDEERPAGLPLLEADPNRGLLFLDLTGLINTHPNVDFYTSAGDGCLTQPGFAGLAQISGVSDGSWGYQGPLDVAPGTDLQLTLHAGDATVDPFQFKCDTSPIHGPVPFSLDAGQRSHLLLYAIPGDPTIRSIILPFGDEQ